MKTYVQHCPVCDVNQTNRELPLGNYEAIRTDPEPMATIAIDFIVGLPEVPSAGSPWQLPGFIHFDQLITVTCKSTRRTMLIPGHRTYKAEDWAKALMRQILLSDWAIPRQIISDRDRKFISAFWKGLWSALGTKLWMTTAYHPQADGLAERKNQSVEIALRFHTFTNPDEDWIYIIPALQWNLNSGYSEAIEASPHELLFGFKIRGPLDSLTASIDTVDVNSIPYLREHLRRDAELATDFAVNRAKARYDSSHRNIEMKPGDEVYLRLGKGYHLPGRPNHKFSQQRSGPFKILRRIGNLAYELDLPSNIKIHPVISVAHLLPKRPGVDPYSRAIPEPGPVEDNQHSDDDAEGDVYETERILDQRGEGSRREYLVKWKGYGHQYNTWEKEHALRHSKELLDDYLDRTEERPRRTRGRPRKS